MRLSAKLLKNVANVNCWEETDQWEHNQLNCEDLYFQLVIPDKDKIRYLSQAIGLTVDVVFPSIDDLLTITKVATQPFAQDISIWKVSLTATDEPGTGAVRFAVNEDPDGVPDNGDEKVTTFKVDQALVIELLNDGGC